MLPDPPVLAVRGATLALGGRVILRDLDFAIPQGQFIGVLGPNGAGKTTLMRAILGLVPVQSGRIELLGHSVRRGQARVGYMPQARGALDDGGLCGRDVVAAAAGHRWGLPILSAAARADVARVIDLVGAGGFAARPVRALSGGEKQRLMLAQALLGAPQLLLLDEPLSSLDPHRQASTIELVRDVARHLGISVLFSAHDLNPLLPALDQVLYLGAGHAALGRVEDVVTGPTLSRLYGTQVEVIHVQGRIFVMAGGVALEQVHHHG